MAGVLLAVSLFCGACAPAEPENVLRRGNGGDPGSLDPALAEDIHAFNVLIDLYEGLVTEAADGALVPGVAESWDISEDGLTYTFHLRDDARWSNGEPVTATDFVYAYRRVADPATGSSYSFLLDPLEHFTEVNAGRMPVDRLGAFAENDETLVLRLGEPASHFLSVLVMPVAFPVHASSVSVGGFGDPERFIGNGAYVLEQRQPGGAIELRRNEQYRDAAAVAIEKVRYLPTTDDGAELNLYRSGELDITNAIPASHLGALLETSPSDVRIAPMLALYYLAFDLTEPPLDNRTLRQALSMAIDRKQLAQLIGRGEIPAFGIVPPGTASHVGATYEWQHLETEDRVARAQALFEQAGYDPANPPTVKLTYDVGDVHERVALAVSSMWQEALGIEVELEKKEWKLLLDTRDRRAAWHVMRFAWFGDYNDPMTFIEIFLSASAQNLPRYTSEEYDEIVARAASATDSSDRLDLMTSAERILIDDYPIAPLYFFVSKHLVSPRVSGFEDNVLDRHPSRHLRFITPE